MFGDSESIETDKDLIKDVLNRQGSEFVLRELSKYAGESAEKFNMSFIGRENLRASLINDLREFLKENGLR